jgi:hypothetical protein
MHVERIVLDEMALDDYLRATPEPARDIIRRIAKGASPRKLLLGGDVAPTLLEDVLADLASRGAITAARDESGADLLTPAVDAAQAVLQGKTLSRRSSTRPPRSVAPAPATLVAKSKSQPPTSQPPASDTIAKEIVSSYETLTLSEPPPPPPASAEDAAPSSLEDAVMREISERSDRPEPRVASDPPPLISPRDLRPRSSNPPSLAGQADDATTRDVAMLPSIPPDAVVPGASSDEVPVAAAQEADDETKPPPQLAEPTEVDAKVAPVSEKHADVEVQVTEPQALKARASEPHEEEESLRPARPERTPLASVARAVPKAAPKKSTWRTLAVLGMLGVVAGFLLRQAAPTPPQAPSSSPAASPHPTQTATQATQATQTATATPAAPGSIFDVPPGVQVAPGMGVLELKTPGDEAVRVDGASRGRGPSLVVQLAPGAHEIRVTIAGTEQRRIIEVQAERSTRVEMNVVP